MTDKSVCGVSAPEGEYSCLKAVDHTNLRPLNSIVTRCENPIFEVIWCGFCMQYSCSIHSIEGHVAKKLIEKAETSAESGVLGA